MDKSPVIVSACLVGLKTRFDGKDALSHEALALLRGRPFIPVCPEQLGGLPTPRPQAVIASGSGGDVLAGLCRVVDENGKDATAEFLRGAECVLMIAGLCGATEAFLKEKSPSCGVKTIYKAGKPAAGEGVTAALLREKGFRLKGF
ncbi:MAG: DUF523 domain-containing protein [Deltaproteobacteria bacterium]|nr:DUF523 domain-containing protein [Deltaproteobacteria bacterium]